MMRRWRQRRLWARMNQQIDGTKFLTDAALLPPGSIVEPPSTLTNNLLGNVELQIMHVEWIDHGAVPRDLWTDERWAEIVARNQRRVMPVHETPEGNRLEVILFDLNQELSAFLAALEEMNR